MKLVHSPRSLRDLEQIAAYLGERSIRGRKSVLGSIKSSIETLLLFPKVGRVVSDRGHRMVLVVGYPYVIFYRIEGNDLYVLHVRHSAREPVDAETEL